MLGKPAELGRSARALFTGSAFVFFWSGGAIFSWIFLPLVQLHRPPPSEQRRQSQNWVQWGFRAFWGYLRLFGLSDFDPRRADPKLPEGPYVMISNHPSLVDVTAILSVIPHLSCVVGGTIYRNPAIKRLLDWCGHIDGGDAEGSLSSALVMVKAIEHLAEGRPVLIFPEGTRSPAHGLRTFQRGAFEVARRAGVPVVPIFISAEPPWLMKHQRWYEVPSRGVRFRLQRLRDEKPEIPGESSKFTAAVYQRHYQQQLEA